MARTYAECVEMNDAARQHGLPLFVAYYRRTLPRFLKVKELIDSGVIGDVRAVQITLTQKPPHAPFSAENLPWRFDPAIAGAGLFLDLASHTLDFLDYALGPIREAHGFAANQGHLYPAEDLVTGSFVFESGVQGVGTWCFTAFEDFDETVIIGSRGKIAFSSFTTDPVRLASVDGAAEFTIEHPPHVQQPLIQTVVEALSGVGTCPSTGESAARTSWVMDQMLAGYRDRAAKGQA